MTKPNYQDATLMLQIAQWSAALGQNEAMNWMWSDQFIADYAEFVKKYPRVVRGVPTPPKSVACSKLLAPFTSTGYLMRNYYSTGWR